MKIKYSDTFLTVNKPKDFNESSTNIFFLHGFTGSSQDWNDLLPKIDERFNKITIDLLGHGKSDFPNNPALYSWQPQVEQINTVINHFTDGKVLLTGYSMGGRLALCYAHTYPERLRGLILESTSPGIRDKHYREKRIVDDEKMAEFISAHPVADFIDLWVGKEIFGTMLRFSNEKREEIKRSKLNNNPIGLANSLYGFSTGKMPDLYKQLNKINVPTLLLTGELDSKFTALNKSIVKLFPSARHKIIKNAGHPPHIEEPARFIDAVNDFLKVLI
ncbi:MAG TPA: 2-succinyl-6-hydroxy-2,4-cyclohexadiene-1-carboxylate synthase [Ignavibacteriaceae bacterium]|nr:2-succinyl-6-hydroxy-2,4-cyclohexadiene-1-carboxylate synthase [Ignavibacteriaceae bacterium]